MRWYIVFAPSGLEMLRSLYFTVTEDDCSGWAATLATGAATSANTEALSAKVRIEVFI